VALMTTTQHNMKKSNLLYTEKQIFNRNVIAGINVPWGGGVGSCVALRRKMRK